MSLCEYRPLRPGTSLWRIEVGPANGKAGVFVSPCSVKAVVAARADKAGCHIDSKAACFRAQAIIEIAEVVVEAHVEVPQLPDDGPWNEGAVSIHCVAGFFMVRVVVGEPKGSVEEARAFHDAAVR